MDNKSKIFEDLYFTYKFGYWTDEPYREIYLYHCYRTIEVHVCVKYNIFSLYSLLSPDKEKMNEVNQFFSIFG